jgi:hypothetical protein
LNQEPTSICVRVSIRVKRRQRWSEIAAKSAGVVQQRRHTDRTLLSQSLAASRFLDGALMANDGDGLTAKIAAALAAARARPAVAVDHPSIGSWTSTSSAVTPVRRARD